jgi:hypothetical protein
MNNIKITTQNLIGDINHKGFLELQSAYGIAQRGGSIISNYSNDHAKRLVSDVNLLSSKERKKIIFNETIYGN